MEQKLNNINIDTNANKNTNIDIDIDTDVNTNTNTNINTNTDTDTSINTSTSTNTSTSINTSTNTNINNFESKSGLEFANCGYCSLAFSRKGNLNKHIKYNCKVKKQQDEEKEVIFKKLLEQENIIKKKDKQIEYILKTKDEQIKLLIEQNKMFENKMNMLTNRINKMSTLKNNIEVNTTNNMSNSNNISNLTTTTTTNSNNVVFQLVNYGKEDLDKIDIKDFINNVVKNNRVCGVKIPEEILKLIHFNPNYPELNNIYISDINREKCMIFDDGMWKLSPDDKIPEVIEKIVKFSYEKQDMLREKFADNKPVLDRLNTINKYTRFTDGEYLEELKEEQENNFNEIKRCEDFQKKTYNTFKTTLYNEGLKIKKK